MPVSKKRKKEGKPVQRREPPAIPGEQPHAPETKSIHAKLRAGKPSNPFVAQQQGKRGSQRGR
jgi:hypothetical protein